MNEEGLPVALSSSLEPINTHAREKKERVRGKGFRVATQNRTEHVVEWSGNSISWSTALVISPPLLYTVRVSSRSPSHQTETDLLLVFLFVNNHKSLLLKSETDANACDHRESQLQRMMACDAQKDALLLPFDPRTKRPCDWSWTDRSLTGIRVHMNQGSKRCSLICPLTLSLLLPALATLLPMWM